MKPPARPLVDTVDGGEEGAGASSADAEDRAFVPSGSSPQAVSPASPLQSHSAVSFATVAREMRHYLDNRLEQFSNGRGYLSDNKTNGYHAAKVPDWQLRQWLAALERDAAPELLEALAITTAFLELEAEGHRSRGDAGKAEPCERQALSNRALIAKATGAA